ncbi:MAG: hypothetical protein HKN18_05100 [Silicimonas sp.]|nr:hypothetical protein [Silicimonas sp.]
MIVTSKAVKGNFKAPNPYMKGDAVVRCVGSTSLVQNRLVAVPFVVNVLEDGKFETPFDTEVD